MINYVLGTVIETWSTDSSGSSLAGCAPNEDIAVIDTDNDKNKSYVTYYKKSTATTSGCTQNSNLCYPDNKKGIVCNSGSKLQENGNCVGACQSNYTEILGEVCRSN